MKTQTIENYNGITGYLGNESGFVIKLQDKTYFMTEIAQVAWAATGSAETDALEDKVSSATGRGFDLDVAYLIISEDIRNHTAEGSEVRNHKTLVELASAHAARQHH